jgi:hypothetical protein
VVFEGCLVRLSTATMDLGVGGFLSRSGVAELLSHCLGTVRLCRREFGSLRHPDLADKRRKRSARESDSFPYRRGAAPPGIVL